MKPNIEDKFLSADAIIKKADAEKRQMSETEKRRFYLILIEIRMDFLNRLIAIAEIMEHLRASRTSASQRGWSWSASHAALFWGII